MCAQTDLELESLQMAYQLVLHYKHIMSWICKLILSYTVLIYPKTLLQMTHHKCLINLRGGWGLSLGQVVEVLGQLGRKHSSGEVFQLTCGASVVLPIHADISIFVRHVLGLPLLEKAGSCYMTLNVSVRLKTQ